MSQAIKEIFPILKGTCSNLSYGANPDMVRWTNSLSSIEAVNHSTQDHEYGYFYYDTSTIPTNAKNLKLAIRSNRGELATDDGEFSVIPTTVNLASYVATYGTYTTPPTADYSKQSPVYTSYPDITTIESDVTLDYVKNGLLFIGGASFSEVTVTSYIKSTTKITYTEYTPEISNLTVTGVNIDNAITCDFAFVDGDSWIVQAIQNNVVLATKAGTIERSCTFNPGDIKVIGPVIFKLIATSGSISTGTSTTATLTWTEPSITGFEPNNVLRRRENQIVVSAIGTNVTSWALECWQSGVKKFTANGTGNNISGTVLENVFASGTVTSKLTVTHVGTGYTVTKEYTVTFTAYGKPNTPLLLLDATYSTPYPLFRWKQDVEQTGFNLSIDSTALTTGDLSSTTSQFKFNDPLANNKTYTARLKIKNQYNLWSDEATVQFNVVFSELASPQFNLYADDTAIVINITSPEDATFHFHEIHRREINGQWMKIASNLGLIAEYKDYGCASSIEYEYRIRAVATNEGYKDSEIKNSMCSFRKNILSVSGEDISFFVKYNVQTSIQNNQDITYRKYCGNEKPSAISALCDYDKYSMSVALKTCNEYIKFKEITEENILLFRGKWGEKAFVKVEIGDRKLNDLYYCDLNFIMVEQPFEEGDFIESFKEGFYVTVSEW